MPMTTEQMKAARNEMLRKLDAAIRSEPDETAKMQMIATADEQAERMFWDECADHYGV